MKLRGRLVLKVAAMVIPFAVLFGLGARHYRTSLVVETIAQGIAARGARDLQRCEQAPEAFANRRGPGRRGSRRGRRFRRVRRVQRFGPGARFGVFDGQSFEGFGFEGRLPEALRRQFEAGEGTAWAEVDRGRLLVGRRLAESGPCAIMVVERRTQVASLGASLLGPLAISVFSLLLVLVAAGPLVRRLRRLEDEVSHDAATLSGAEGTDEIGALVRAFSDARGNLQRSIGALEERERTLSEYIANTTHDVMLPLTVLQGHLVALRGQVDGTPSEAGVALAMEESHYLASMLQNMNAVARLEGELVVETEAVDLGDIVERVIARNAPIAKERRVEINHAVPGKPVPVLGDSTLLQRAIGNVVVNAIRYNEPGGHVAVVLEERHDEQGGFELRILDDGPGVSDEELERLGERRHRGAARSRHPSGSGLGLSIAKDVAARHGFVLRFEHGPEGRGLEVVFSGATENPSPR